jgi:hypothetical protein
MNNAGSVDGILVKYDKNGTKLWSKLFGGTTLDGFYSVIEARDKSLIMVGTSNSSNVGFTTNGGQDAIIIKYDSDGDMIWIKNFGGSATDKFEMVIETDDGGFVAIGESSSSNAGFTNKGGYDGIIVKYDELGNQCWVNNFGGSEGDYAYSVAETSDSGLVMLVRVGSSDAGFENKGGGDSAIVKFNKDGEKVWMNSFGGSKNDEFAGVIEGIDGGILVVGYTYSTDIEGLSPLSSDSNSDAIIIRYDKDGNQEWVKNFGGTGNDEFQFIVETRDGGFLISGSSSSTDSSFSNIGSRDAFVIKYRDEYIEEKMIEITSIYNTNRNLRNARMLINEMPESIKKDSFQEALNAIFVDDLTLDPELISSNLDIYVLSKNSLSLSLVNSSITFDDFSGLSDVTISDALSFTINSSIDYNVSVSLVGNIVSSNGNVLDKSIFNIKASSDTAYKNYSSSDTLSLFTNQTAGNNKTHKVDMMLKGNVAHTADVYKAVLKISVEQV